MARVSHPFQIHHLMAVVAVIAVMLLCLDSLPGGWACGGYDLRVNLSVPSGRKVVAVAAGSAISLEKARHYLLDFPQPLVQVEPVSWVPGKPFAARIPCGARISALSMRRMSPWQYHALILRVDYDDGIRQFFAWEIPNRNRAREVSVTISKTSGMRRAGVRETASISATLTGN